MFVWYALSAAGLGLVVFVLYCVFQTRAVRVGSENELQDIVDWFLVRYIAPSALVFRYRRRDRLLAARILGEHFCIRQLVGEARFQVEMDYFHSTEPERDAISSAWRGLGLEVWYDERNGGEGGRCVCRPASRENARRAVLEIVRSMDLFGRCPPIHVRAMGVDMKLRGRRLDRGFGKSLY